MAVLHLAQKDVVVGAPRRLRLPARAAEIADEPVPRLPCDPLAVALRADPPETLRAREGANASVDFVRDDDEARAEDPRTADDRPPRRELGLAGPLGDRRLGRVLRERDACVRLCDRLRMRAQLERLRFRALVPAVPASSAWSLPRGAGTPARRPAPRAGSTRTSQPTAPSARSPRRRAALQPRPREEARPRRLRPSRRRRSRPAAARAGTRTTASSAGATAPPRPNLRARGRTRA